MPDKVRLLDDPVLRKPCSPVNELDIVFINGLLDSMHETMKAENGVGLAANQIGHSIRVFILKEGDSYREFINPEITSTSDLVNFENEACLSIPGAFATTKRFKKLTLTWLDKNGTKKEEEFVDFLAFAVQHEMDHINGKLYIDQFGPMKRQLVVGKHKKYLRMLGRK